MLIGGVGTGAADFGKPESNLGFGVIISGGDECQFSGWWSHWRCRVDLFRMIPLVWLVLRERHCPLRLVQDADAGVTNSWSKH